MAKLPFDLGSARTQLEKQALSAVALLLPRLGATCRWSETEGEGEVCCGLRAAASPLSLALDPAGTSQQSRIASDPCCRGLFVCRE